MIHKYLLFLLLVGVFVSCTVGEPELNPKQNREITNRVRAKVDSFSRQQWKICFENAANAARPAVDSIIASFDARIPSDSIKAPGKPLKPNKPSVEIPTFEENVGPKGNENENKNVVTPDSIGETQKY